MQNKPCIKCSCEVPVEFFDLYISSEEEHLQAWCIMCIYKEAQKVIGDHFIFTDLNAVTKFNGYCKHFKLGIEINAGTIKKT